MTKDQWKGIAEWLDGIDSHGIYALPALNELEKFGITTFRDGRDNMKMSIDGGKTSVFVPIHTAASQRRAMEKRGLGGTLDENAGMSFNGWEIAGTLCELLGLGDPGGMFSGRGKQYQYRLAAIKKKAAE